MLRTGTVLELGSARSRYAHDAGASFERLYREAYPLVYNYTYRRLLDRYATEDVVSEAFLRAARSFGSFDPSRSKFSTWVVAIARNCIVDHFRGERSGVAIDDVPETVFAQDDDFTSQIGDADLAANLLSVLEDDERELVFMRYYEGKRNVEIADELGMNPSTVATKLARAMAKMRNAAEGGR